MNQANHFRGTQEQMEVLKQDFSRVEVVGSCKPLSHAPVCQSSSVEKEEQEKEQKKIKGNPDPLARDNVNSDALHGPALRICGKLARWTGSSEDKQGEVGIDAEVLFEALTGEIASSHLELYNQGSTAIFYSWEKLCVPNGFPNLIKTYPTHFYFNSSSDVILPGVTKRMEILFKAVRPGIETEKWRLKTHPLLLGGASMLVTLTGFALYQDKNAEQRLFIKTELEKRVTVKLCRSIVDERVQGIHTPERPSSPAELYTTELYTTEEQQFLSKNPKESDEMGKRFRGKEEKESNLLTDTQTENVSQPEAEQPELTEIYRRLLHQKVYAGILDLVDNLCAMVDELH